MTRADVEQMWSDVKSERDAVAVMHPATVIKCPMIEEGHGHPDYCYCDGRSWITVVEYLHLLDIDLDILNK